MSGFRKLSLTCLRTFADAMPTFIDESGDVGIKPDSARHYRLAAVWLENKSQVEACTETFKALRSSLNLREDYEFHFAKIDHSRKIALFNSIKVIPFRFALCSIDKTTFVDESLSKHWVLRTAVESLTNILEETYLPAESKRLEGGHLNEPIKYDECNDKNYSNTLKECFRRTGVTKRKTNRLIGDIKTASSRTDSCIQLVDMICGAVGNFLDGSSDYYDLIGTEKQIKVVQIRNE